MQLYYFITWKINQINTIEGEDNMIKLKLF